MTDLFRKLDIDLREAIGVGPDEVQIADHRSQVVGGVLDKLASRKRTARIAWGAGFGLAAAAAVIAVLAVWPAQGTGLRCQVNGRPIAEGSWITGDGGRDAQMRFSDSSLVRVAPDARMRLAEIEPKRARLSLESGRIESAISPDHGIEWSFEAGPFRVRVVGTQFSMLWSPGSGTLAVDVDHGRVAVSMEGRAEQLVEVATGERLTARTQGSQLFTLERRAADQSGSQGMEARSSAQPPNALPVAGFDQDSRQDSLELAPGRQRARGPAGESEAWQKLANEGKYEEAMILAKEAGFEGLVLKLPVWQLLLLADAARLSGNIDLADQALIGLRRRFAGHEAAAVAAFRLGRLEFDRGASSRAATWFRTFLKEAPEHRLANDARGRCMEALHLTREDAAAREFAREYLRRSPNGDYAKLARSLAEEVK